MAPLSKVFPTLLFLISAYYISELVPLVSGSCEASFDCRSQTSYSITDQPSMHITLYFDGSNKPDVDFVRAMCKARSLFENVEFTFVPGVRLLESSTGKLLCPTGNCFYSLVDACALTLAHDFTEFVCVEYYDKSVKSMMEAYKKVGIDSKVMDKCIDHPDQNINPQKTLLQNSQNAMAAHPNDQCIPYISFNGTSDACARAIFVEDPAAVICAMLASNSEKECANYT